MESSSLPLFSLLLGILSLTIFPYGCQAIMGNGFKIEEATIKDLHLAFEQNQLTSRLLIEFYIKRIHKFNHILNAIIELNPDALSLADKADQELKDRTQGSILPRLHGIPILLKDNIATKDKLNTTAGSFALLGSVVSYEATVVTKLRNAGAIILGKANMAEWAALRSSSMPTGWSARGGYGKNPYNLAEQPGGSSSGSAISVATNMVAVSLGTDSSGSILYPAALNSVVGIRPTFGLISRTGIIPYLSRYDTIGPMSRTVSDAVYVLDSIIGIDHHDSATREASQYISKDSYVKFLKIDGLKGKRLGITRSETLFRTSDPMLDQTLKEHAQTFREQGAVLIDHLNIPNLERHFHAKATALDAIFSSMKSSLNGYLKQLLISPVRSLKDVIKFNNENPGLESTMVYEQDLFLRIELARGVGIREHMLLTEVENQATVGFEKVMKEKNLDALISPIVYAANVLPYGGFPIIMVPAGYSQNGVPFGICFSGLKGSEATLIEIAYGFEQATKIRKPPSLENI